MKQAKGKEKEEDFDQSSNGKEKEEDFDQSRKRGKEKEKEEDFDESKKIGRGKENEEDAACLEKHHREVFPSGIKSFVKELHKTLEIGSARRESQQDSSGSVEAQTTTMSQDQIDLMKELLRERVPMDSIRQMMGVHEDTVDSVEFTRVMLQTKLSAVKSWRKEGERASETFPTET